MVARKTPVTPPMMKLATKPMQNSIGVVRRTFPFHIVVIQLKVLTADGIAIANETAMNDTCSRRSMPVENMWWAQTPKLRTPIASVE
jgi:hypothetical protein